METRPAWVRLLRCLFVCLLISYNIRNFVCAEFPQLTKCATNASKSTATQRCADESWADLLKWFSASQVWNMLAHPAVYCRWERTRCSAVAVIADRTAYDWQTIKLVLVTSLRNDGMHDPIQRTECTMNPPKLYLLKRDNWMWRTKVQ